MESTMTEAGGRLCDNRYSPIHYTLYIIYRGYNRMVKKMRRVIPSHFFCLSWMTYSHNNNLSLFSYPKVSSEINNQPRIIAFGWFVLWLIAEYLAMWLSILIFMRQMHRLKGIRCRPLHLCAFGIGFRISSPGNDLSCHKMT